MLNGVTCDMILRLSYHMICQIVHTYFPAFENRETVLEYVPKYSGTGVGD